MTDSYISLAEAADQFSRHTLGRHFVVPKRQLGTQTRALKKSNDPAVREAHKLLRALRNLLRQGPVGAHIKYGSQYTPLDFADLLSSPFNIAIALNGSLGAETIIKPGQLGALSLEREAFAKLLGGAPKASNADADWIEPERLHELGVVKRHPRTYRRWEGNEDGFPRHKKIGGRIMYPRQAIIRYVGRLTGRHA